MHLKVLYLYWLLNLRHIFALCEASTVAFHRNFCVFLTTSWRELACPLGLESLYSAMRLSSRAPYEGIQGIVHK